MRPGVKYAVRAELGLEVFEKACASQLDFFPKPSSEVMIFSGLLSGSTIANNETPLKLLTFEGGQFLLKLVEFVVVSLAIVVAFGNVVPEAFELGHSVENFACDLKNAVLHLEKGYSVLRVEARCRRSLEAALQFHAYSQTACVIAGRDYAFTT